MVNLLQQAARALKVSNSYASIVDFIDKEHHSKLYPRQRVLLKAITLDLDDMTEYEESVIDDWIDMGEEWGEKYGLPIDFWERYEFTKKSGAKWFPQVVLNMGRRSSKTYTTSKLPEWQTYTLLETGCPQTAIGFDPDHEIQNLSIATSKQRAMDGLFRDLQKSFEECKYFDDKVVKSSMDRIAFESDYDRLKKAKQKKNITRTDYSVYFTPVAADPAAVRGMAPYSILFDEIAFIPETGGVKDLRAVVQGAEPALATAGKYQQLIYTSSPENPVGVFFDACQQAQILKGSDKWQPTMFYLHLKSWDLYKDSELCQELYGYDCGDPMMYEPKKNGNSNEQAMWLRKQKDVERFEVEFEAKWASPLDSYFSFEKVKKCFDIKKYSYNDPITHIEVNTDKYGNPKEEIYGYNNAYHMHFDPSKNSANFAILLGHAEERDGEKHFFVDKKWCFKPANFEDGVIDQRVIESEIKKVMDSIHNLEITGDQYNSSQLLINLKDYAKEKGYSHKIYEVTATSDQIKRQTSFREWLYRGNVHTYEDKYYEDEYSQDMQEFKTAQTDPKGAMIASKVGPVRTVDMLDTYVETVWRALGDVNMFTAHSSRGSAIPESLKNNMSGTNNGIQNGNLYSPVTRTRGVTGGFNGLNNGRALSARA